MQTRVTELFKIKYPVLLSGMSWISVPEMVAAVSNAVGLGILATEEGNNEKGILTVGQVTGLVHDIPTVSELLERTIAEAKEVQEKVTNMMS